MRPKRNDFGSPALCASALALLALLGTACGGGGDAAAPDGGNQNEQQTGARGDWDALVWDEDDWS